MHKLAALVPLLGWFYFSLFGFVLAMILLPKSWKRSVYKIFFASFVIYALFLSLQSFRDEVLQFPLSQKSFYDTFEQKISYQAGEYYRMYYRTFRPYVHGGEIVNMLNVSTREFYYARMYLFPADVSQVSTIPNDSVLAIVGEGDLKHIVGTKVLATYATKSLVKTKELPND